jgi:opacity protein-like surface antigen
MKTLLFVFISVCLLVAPSFAEDRYPQVELFGGYSYLHFPYFNGDVAGSIPKGWAAGVTGNFNRHFGAEAAFSGHYDEALARFSSQIGHWDSTHLFLFGPKASVRLQKVTPWAHALLGTTFVQARVQNGNTAYGYGPGELRESATRFAWAIGGGIDYPFQKNVALRVQADNIGNNLRPQFQVHGAGYFIQIPPFPSNDLRVSVGMVFRFRLGGINESLGFQTGSRGLCHSGATRYECSCRSRTGGPTECATH